MAFTAINTEFNYKMGNYSTGSTNEKKQPNNSSFYNRMEKNYLDLLYFLFHSNSKLLSFLKVSKTSICQEVYSDVKER